MKIKLVVAGIVVVVGIVFGAMSFMESNVEYTDLQTARETQRRVQVKGEWVRDKESMFDASRGQFVFYLKDDNGQEARVIYEGAKPNNFELATSVVVKGRYRDGEFHASDILTKCPSKYDADASAVRKTL